MSGIQVITGHPHTRPHVSPTYRAPGTRPGPAVEGAQPGGWGNRSAVEEFKGRQGFEEFELLGRRGERILPGTGELVPTRWRRPGFQRGERGYRLQDGSAAGGYEPESVCAIRALVIAER